jgi:hypothetical protein
MRKAIRILLIRPALDNDLICEGERDRGHANVKATDTITLVEGYDAMRIFLEAVRRRHCKTAEEIEFIIGGLKWADGSPVDTTMWEDWLAAVQIACSGRSQ